MKRRRLGRQQWLRCAVYGLLWVRHEHEVQWRERFYALDALCRDLARELGELKARQSFSR